MKKMFVLTLLVSVFSFASNSAEKIKEKDIVGEWKYTVSSVPAEYETGTLVFEEKENKLTGKVKFSAGYDADFNKVELKENTLTFGLYVDYEYISGEVKIDGKKMEGTVNTPDGKVPLKAEKVK